MSSWSFVRRLKKEVRFSSRARASACLLACWLPTGKERTIATRIPVVPVVVSKYHRFASFGFIARAAMIEGKRENGSEKMCSV